MRAKGSASASRAGPADRGLHAADGGHGLRQPDAGGLDDPRGLKLLAKSSRCRSSPCRSSRRAGGPQGRAAQAPARGSAGLGSIEQDADVVIFLYREELYDRETERKGIADVIIAKQRNGPTGDFSVVFLGDHMTFANYAGGPPVQSEGQPF
jgi:hypothetical protein